MRIATFFQPVKDSENLDLKTVITVPDQSLSVRDILMRFTRGQMELPDIDTGPDDDIDSDVNDFEDYVDALDSIDSAKRSMQFESIKNAGNNEDPKEETKQSEVTDEGSDVSE